MGFYIRKAIKVGPFRFNLSKSGVGVSAGVKGLRLGAGPRGNYVHMGRGGLYFRKSLNRPGAHPTTPRPDSPRPAAHETVDPVTEIESGPLSQMVDTSSAELLAELNAKRRKVRLLPFAFAFVGVALLFMALTGAPLLVFYGVAPLVAAGLWVIHQQDQLRRTTVILYQLEGPVEEHYQQLHDAFDKLNSSSAIWHIEAEGAVRDRKYHAGAGAVVRRRRISLSSGMPPLIKTNVSVPQIPVGRQTLAFMPDRLLVFEPGAVGAIPYGDLDLDLADVRFVEDEPVPRDATVVDHTWRYVNKKGGPDRRFKDNRQIPICLYGQIHFRSATGLNEVVQSSRAGVTEAFGRAVGEPATAGR